VEGIKEYFKRLSKYLFSTSNDEDDTIGTGV